MLLPNNPEKKESETTPPLLSTSASTPDSFDMTNALATSGVYCSNMEDPEDAKKIKANELRGVMIKANELCGVMIKAVIPTFQISDRVDESRPKSQEVVH